MPTRTPTVSVSLVTYNHEKFVAESIRSILNQTFTDLELVIVDDGSTDDTPRVIASFDDPRIVSIRQKNGGPGAATNRALAACRGKYVVLMTGDDVSVPHRIQTQLDEYSRGEPRLVFSACDFIDDESRPLTGRHFAEKLFDVTPRTRAQWLRQFYDFGNVLNAVTGFTETRLFQEMGPYDGSLFQLQDLEMWLRFLKKYAIQVLPKTLLHYRIRNDGANLSTPSPAGCIRYENELFLIQRNFFRDMPDDLFREAFADRLRRPDLAGHAAARCEQAFLFLNSAQPLRRLLGIEQFQTLFRDAETAALLENEFQFSIQKFVATLGALDHFSQYHDTWTKLYVDTGAGFREAEICKLPALHTPRFDIRFDLSRFGPVKALRWDPLELRFCRVRLERATWTDAAGRNHEWEPDTLATNGARLADGSFDFETIDPIVFLPVNGDVRTVTLEGSWTIQDRYESLIGTHAVCERSAGRLHNLHHLMACTEAANAGLRAELAARTRQRDQTLEWRVRRFVRQRLPGLHRVARHVLRRARSAAPLPVQT